jgi:hypothetical protein
MKPILALTILITYFLGVEFVQAQRHSPDFQLRGVYTLEGQAGRQVNFTLEWQEADDGALSGKYSDNYFTRSSDIKGKRTQRGREFLIDFNEPVKGVRTIAVFASLRGKEDTATSAPVSFTLRDPQGNPVTSVKTQGEFFGKQNLISMIPPRPPVESERGTGAGARDESCVEHFGVLAGFCGFYSGTVVEERDFNDQCDLLAVTAIRLELSESWGEVRLHFDQDTHIVGRIPASPQSRGVDLMGRVCTRLPRTKFPDENCKRLHLDGSFTAGQERPAFTGTYSIIDEGTHHMCKYRLSVSREGDVVEEEQ